MILNFVNGTEVQKQACRDVAHNLLNLPFDSIPLNLTIEFVKDPSPTIHDEFGFAEWSYGSPSGTIRIANIAPSWPEPWRGIKFLREVFAHEVGHIFFAALPQARRAQIAQMFGAKSDDEAVVNPKSQPWEKRVTEGIAETFKDAFLPQRYRRHANRTQRRISLSLYPEFRALFRQVPGDRLSFFHPDGRNAYEEDIGEEDIFPGSIYEPTVKHTPNNSSLEGGVLLVGPADAGSVITARLRPYSLVNGFAPGGFSQAVLWRVNDENVFSSNVELQWVFNDGLVRFRPFIASADDGADYFNLELLGASSAPGNPTEPYNIGLPEGDLRGFNITIPEDIAELAISASVLTLWSVGSEGDTLQDESRIASFKTMTEGTGISVTAPTGNISPGASDGGRVRSPHPVRGG